ncbi:hypothetical protein PsAD13_03181 [Pseudovibrio sp. Ad13]|uniref:hypothetical protein n=1 Tax=Pseudovibrio sp. Ad13 TaxID=989396 RepID=UPI0007B1F606|nr:hypothetical protein [Pseudovibrio sp. Ad13]KZK82979.1 hypothetical protein PsAD13_03181 [Pseudovibrio sp. Ad13]
MTTEAILKWRSMETYQSGGMALFWVDTGYDQYPVYGYINIDGEIWDDNDAGYGDGNNAVLWSEFSPPKPDLN